MTEKRPSILGRVLELLVIAVIAAAIALFTRGFVAQPYVIPSGSMIPTIEIGDMVLAEKLTYALAREPQQGDIVVFADPNGVHDQLIKRVVATGGQTVDVRDGKVWVDDKVLDEPYTHGVESLPGTVQLPIKLQQGEIWLMGDNRPESGDSRFFGPQSITTVKGRAFWRHWPLNRFGKLE